MVEPANILVVEDDSGSRTTLAKLLEDEGYSVTSCETAKAALNHLIDNPTDVVISDLILPDGSGLQILWALKKINPDAALILVTGYATLENAIEAVNLGAFAYHVKPLDIVALMQSVRNAVWQQFLSTMNKALVEENEQSYQDLRSSNIQLKRELGQISLPGTHVLSSLAQLPEGDRNRGLCSPGRD